MADISNYFDTLWHEKCLDPKDETNLKKFFDDLAIQLQTQIDEKEEVINRLTTRLSDGDKKFKTNLDKKSQKLNELTRTVNDTIIKFRQSSEGAVRIGGRLSSVESDRIKLMRAIDIMKCIKYLEKLEPLDYEFALKDAKTFEQMRRRLPKTLRKKDTCDLCKMLLDLRKTLIDINNYEVLKAQANIISISQAVESELLDQFEGAVTEILVCKEKSQPVESSLILHAQELAISLQYFTNGSSLERRYLFGVVQQMLLQNSSRFIQVSDGFEMFAAQQSRTPPLYSMSVDSNHTNKNSAVMNDHLAELFGSISSICIQQFEIIHEVFPKQAATRMVKLLLQRVFNDPAFGIQAHIEHNLFPSTPYPPLSLQEYLQTLCEIREKLDAFYMILSDYCRQYHVFLQDSTIAQLNTTVNPHNSMKETSDNNDHYSHTHSNTTQVTTSNNNNRNNNNMGMSSLYDSRNTTTSRISRKRHSVLSHKSTTSMTAGGDSGQSVDYDYYENNFLRIQINSIFNTYLVDYYPKEMTHLKFQYNQSLNNALISINLAPKQTITSTTVLSFLPIVKAEKFKTIANIARTIGNHDYIDQLFYYINDSLHRMGIIGQDDKKLPSRIKDMFLLHIKFVMECVLSPSLTAMITMLLKLSSSSIQSSTLPPIEFLTILGASLTAIDKIKKHFQDSFMPYILESSNTIIFCQEALKPLVKKVLVTSSEAFLSWTYCIAMHIDKMLLTLQSKFDFNPQHSTTTTNTTTTMNNNTTTNSHTHTQFNDGKIKQVIYCTDACTHVVKTLLIIASSIRYYKDDLIKINLIDCLWGPLGQLLIGVYMTHMKRNKISPMGAIRLLQDLDEYFQLSTVLESPETLDMWKCLKDLAGVYSVSSDHVTKYVMESLRHLDTSIVLALVKSRSDYGTSAGAEWARELSSMYTSLSNTPSFPWENRRSMTVMTFRTLISSSSDPQMLGPLTLRKTSVPLSTAVLLELTQQNIETTAAYKQTQQFLFSKNNAPTIHDISQMNYQNTQLSKFATNASAVTSQKNQAKAAITSFIPTNILDSVPEKKNKSLKLSSAESNSNFLSRGDDEEDEGDEDEEEDFESMMSLNEFDSDSKLANDIRKTKKKDMRNKKVVPQKAKKLFDRVTNFFGTKYK